MEVTILNCRLLLTAEKIIYLPENAAIILSDLHLTKDVHFRKNGIGVPALLTHSTLNRLSSVIEKYKPSQIFILGDMFHSDYNNGVQIFELWRAKYSEIPVNLIHGNHDIFRNDIYKNMGIETIGDSCILDNILLTHEPVLASKLLNICGHLHPVVKISGNARQSIRMPCFYFNGSSLILPAFGEFTGGKYIHPKKGQKVFAIADEKIIEVL